MSTPLFSIVIPTFNHAPYIAQSIYSILGLGSPHAEIIVIDGGSTDGTAEVVAGFGAAITHFISEKDRGQGDAINKGFRLAKGDLLAWLNSDDYYLLGAFAKVAPLLGDGREPRLAHGGTIAHFATTNEVKLWSTPRIDREQLRTRDYVYQPSAFWTRALWEKTGELDLSLNYILDWDWFFRASEHCEFMPVDAPLSVYLFHDGHKTSSGGACRNAEVCEFVEKNAGPEWGAAFRNVAEALPTLVPGLKKLKRFGLYRWRRLIYRRIYRQHGEKVKVALSQLML